MTTDTATPQTTYTVAGTGPYNVLWPFDGGDLVVTVVQGGTVVTLTDGEDWTVAPDGGPSGAVTLSAPAALAHAGKPLIITRATAQEQGWQGQSGREVGLMTNLDRLTRGLQDVRATANAALRLPAGEAAPFALTDGRMPVWQGNRLVDGPVAAEVTAGVPAALDAAERAEAAAAMFDGLVASASTLATLPTATIVGRIDEGTGSAQFLSQADGRSVLGLVPQSGPTDATTGRLMTVGAFGLGAVAGTFFNTGPSFGAPMRHPNRMFVGVGHTHGGQFDGSVTGGSWLQSFASPGLVSPIVGWDYHEDQARFVSVSEFGLALSGAVRTNGSEGIGVSGVAIGTAGAANMVASGSFAVGIVYTIVVVGTTNFMSIGAVSNTVGVTFTATGTGVDTDTGTARRAFTAWGSYFDGVRLEVASGSVSGNETNGTQVAEPSPGNAGWASVFHMGQTPVKPFVSGQVTAMRIAAGSDASVFGRSYAVDAAITIQDNGAAFWTGLNFRFDAIMREGMTDNRAAAGMTGYARAISLAHDHGLSWYSSLAEVYTAGAFVIGRLYIIQVVGSTDFTLIGAASNTPGAAFRATGVGTGTGTASLAGSQNEVLRVHSTITDPTIRQSLVFSDTTISFNERTSPNASLFQIDYRDDAGANIFVSAAAVGAGPVIGVRGINADISMFLSPKGTGWVSFGAIGNVRDYANDAAAAAGGLNVGAIYRTGSTLKVRAA